MFLKFIVFHITGFSNEWFLKFIADSDRLARTRMD